MRLSLIRNSRLRRFGTIAVALGLVATQTAGASAEDSRGTLKNFQHVWVIMMENTGYTSLIGNANAPWINGAAATYGFARKSYGVTHPSQANYVAITSGSTQGVTNDGDVTINATNIVDQLESHGKTWTDYQQALGLCATKLDHACGNQLYERKHNPFVSYTDVQASPARMANVVDLNQLDADLASGHVADYNFIAPDQCHDMHGRGAPAADPCSYANEQSLIASGDAFLAGLVGRITSSSSWNGNSVIFITWDESDYPFGDVSGCCTADPGGGHVVTLTISASAHEARVSDTPYNHYSILATIEDGWKLGCLNATCDTSAVPRMTDLVGPDK